MGKLVEDVKGLLNGDVENPHNLLNSYGWKPTWKRSSTYEHSKFPNHQMLVTSKAVYHTDPEKKIVYGSPSKDRKVSLKAFSHYLRDLHTK